MVGVVGELVERLRHAGNGSDQKTVGVTVGEAFQACLLHAAVVDRFCPSVEEAKGFSEVEPSNLGPTVERIWGRLKNYIANTAVTDADHRQIAEWLQGHWRIENSVHHVRDVTFDEDRSQVCIGSASPPRYDTTPATSTGPPNYCSPAETDFAGALVKLPTRPQPRKAP
ncbi:hypothetical protein ABIA39_007188 [Nocardia sp. GAS34]|uniref:hypothetical protein n=1 Tax=unclassified Nocardia TaxID=2637762 RepID=UPI003D1B3EC5